MLLKFSTYSSFKSRCLLLLILIFSSILVFISTQLNFHHPEIKSNRTNIMAAKHESDFWKTRNFLSKQIPSNLKEKLTKVNITKGIKDINSIKVFYRRAAPYGCQTSKCSSDKLDILLLHGKAFTSQTWVNPNLMTIQYLSAMGYQAIAVDLPGYGESKQSKLPGTVKKEEFLFNIIKEFQLKNPVIISPSMSGTYSVPFLVNYWKNISAYVPVAPVMASTLKDDDLMTIHLPTLVVYGENDRGLGTSSAITFGKMPCSVLAEIPKGEHPAYLSDPDRFHQLLYNFLTTVEEKLSSPIIV